MNVEIKVKDSLMQCLKLSLELFLKFRVLIALIQYLELLDLFTIILNYFRKEMVTLMAPVLLNETRKWLTILCQ